MAVSARQMIIVFLGLLGAVALLTLPQAALGEPVRDAVDRGPSGAPHVAGELLVTYKKGASERGVASVEGTAGEVEKSLPEIHTQLLRFPEIKNERAAEVRERALRRVKEKLARNPAVESVEYNYVRRYAYVPDDPEFGAQWGLRKSRFPESWDATRGSGVRIAVVDGGIAQRHPDLREKIAVQHDFVHGDPVAEDGDGHGTHVAGIAAASTGNGVGVAGGCPGCRLVIAKVTGPFGGDDADIADGIIWSADKGAKAINISLGGPEESSALNNAIDYATNRGAVVVVAAGNEAANGNPKMYPAAYPGAIAVAATNKDDARARFSGYGDWVDVAAPGVGILSTVPGGYERHDGTSMASPQVAALAGLLAAQGRTGVRARILRTATDLGPAGRDPYYGAGRIDAAAATAR